MADLRERLLAECEIGTQAVNYRFAAAVRAVLQFHRPNGTPTKLGFMRCRGCGIPMPCDTLLALAGPLGLTEEK